MAFIKIRQSYYEGTFSDRFVIFFIFGSLFFCAISAFLILFNWKGLPPRLPIFYSMPWGEANLGPRISIWILPGFSFFIILVNLFFINFFVRNNQFLVRILAIVIFMCSFFALYDLVKIIRLLV